MSGELGHRRLCRQIVIRSGSVRVRHRVGVGCRVLSGFFPEAGQSSGSLGQNAGKPLFPGALKVGRGRFELPTR